MKKLIVAILLVIVLSFPVLAESLDLSGYTIEELQYLKAAIEAELANKLEDTETIVYDGEYVIGNYIETGTCNVYSLGGHTRVMLYASEESYLNGEQSLSACSLSIKRPAHFELDEGEILIVWGDPCVLKRIED